MNPSQPAVTRSTGVLNQQQLDRCRAEGVQLAYDPVQIGWVRVDCLDDITSVASPGADLRGDNRTGSIADPLEALKSVELPSSSTVTSVGAAPGQRIQLRRWKSSDAVRYRSLLDNPRIWEYLPEQYPDPLTEEMVHDLIDISNNAGHHDVYAIETDGEVVGQVRMLYLAADNTSSAEIIGSDRQACREAEISYWLGQDYWGRGIATDAISNCLQRSFEQNPQLASVIARVDARNPASAGALQKCGFQPHLQGQSAATEVDGMLVFRCVRDPSAQI